LKAFSGNPGNAVLLSKKQVCPKGASAKRATFLESFGKIETPRKGQNTSDTKKPTLRQTTKKALL